LSLFTAEVLFLLGVVWRVAKKLTSDVVFGKVVDVEPVDRGRYGRTVAWVRVNGKSLNKELLRAGLA
jgi:micrococcal nuclease